tara:strand:- start:146 stop:1468 length:1323 start_codon:yes stop_codon:yes gene_type:complete
MKSTLALAALAISSVTANDNGLAITPPLGWRSWNLFGNNVNQELIMNIMKGMTDKSRTVNGKPASLCDLGYCDVGLDDNWQACGSKDAAPGMHYHDVKGNPLVNYQRFPDFKNMTDYAHTLGLTSGWYGNNCDCSDHCTTPEMCDMQIKQDVAAHHKYGFDSWKLDGCGGETDLVAFNKYVLLLNKSIMVENCHWGSKVPFQPDRSKPPAEGCPWNFYRSSGDVRASYASILSNLKSTNHLYKSNLSYPGCWAYPDMLQVGCQHGPGGASDPGLTMSETRTHFGAWSIVSSPLTLSHDVNNDTVTDKIWDIITNMEVLEVNQDYVGDSGGVYDESSETVELTDAFINSNAMEDIVVTPSYQYLSKPISHGRVAVLLMNSGDQSEILNADFSKIPALKCLHGTNADLCHVRDIWNHKDLGDFKGKWSGSVESHDAAFLVIS